MAGLYFQEFQPEQEFVHPWSRTVTEMDNTMFSLLTMNPQPLHIDAHSPRRPSGASGCSTACTRWAQRDEVVAVCRRTALMRRTPAQ